MRDFETYVFDLDGTLLETLNDLAASTNYALRTCRMPEHSVEEVRMFVGNGVKKLMERAVPDGKENPMFEKVLSLFRSHYLEHNLDTTQPYNGIPELLSELNKRGKKLAIVSNKFDAATKDLAKHFFADTIEVAIGERENIRKKPAPDTVLEALRQLGASKSGAVYIGDSDVDIMTAKNSGLPCASVLWGFRDKDFLIRHGATFFAEKPEDLLPD
ncbi:UNVERIFIED_CONTAM: HAD family hydrolase [Prevotella sp. 15_C9]